jgi:hypothetical protein
MMCLHQIINMTSLLADFAPDAIFTVPDDVIAEMVDDRDAPNIYPYKKCSVCGERKSCGNYQENDWFCEDCEAPKPVVLCADCGDAIPDTENLDKCWTNDGETFWCEGCREDHVEEYIRERDGDDDWDRYVCGVCGKTEPKDVEWDVGDSLDFRGDVICPACEAP